MLGSVNQFMEMDTLTFASVNSLFGGGRLNMSTSISRFLEARLLKCRGLKRPKNPITRVPYIHTLNYGYRSRFSPPLVSLITHGMRSVRKATARRADLRPWGQRTVGRGRRRGIRGEAAARHIFMVDGGAHGTLVHLQKPALRRLQKLPTVNRF